MKSINDIKVKTESTLYASCSNECRYYEEVDNEYLDYENEHDKEILFAKYRRNYRRRYRGNFRGNSNN